MHKTTALFSAGYQNSKGVDADVSSITIEYWTNIKAVCIIGHDHGKDEKCNDDNNTHDYVWLGSLDGIDDLITALEYVKHELESTPER